MTLAGVFSATACACWGLIFPRRRRCSAFRLALPFLLARYFRRAFHSDHCRAASLQWELQ